MATVQQAGPIRAGIFESVEAARRAIQDLRSAGFQRNEINVVCQDANAAPDLREYIHERPAGPKAAGGALTKAGMVYGVLALVGVAAAAITAIIVGLVAAFIVLGICLGIALLSVFGSIMVQRGGERELADFHAQALEPGQLLVAVDLDDQAAPDKVAAADRVLQHDARTTFSLPHEV